MKDVVVLGTGCAAWGVWDRFSSEGISARYYDKNTFGGGHTASFASKGFVFDDGPHISFTEVPDLQAVFAEAVDGEYESHTAAVDNWYKGTWVKHPAIAFLHSLPSDLVVKCLADFIEASQHPMPGSFSNYEEWLQAAYGTTFSETFPAAYGRKYHTCGPEAMNTSWLGPRLYRPALEEVLLGAVAPPQAEKHYISSFRYPKRDGFVRYLRKFLESGNVSLGHEVVKIDPSERIVYFANGTATDYSSLISSVPLPEYTKLIPNMPSEVRAAADRLSCTQCVTVNLGVTRADLSPSHWRYIYDEDRPSVRLSFPHMFSESTVPDGCGAVQVEVYFSDKYKPLDCSEEEIIASVKKDLIDFGTLREDDTVLVEEARFVKYANVIFDHDSDPSAEIVKAYLSELDIEVCGRYGDWAYIWTDQSFVSGTRAAQRILDGRR